MPKVEIEPLRLAGLLEADDKTDFIFTLKVATAMMYARKLGQQARKSNE